MKVGAEISKRFVTNVLGTLLGFAGTIFFTRELGFDGIGVYSIFLGMQMIAANLATFGLFPVLVKNVSEGEAEARHFASATLILLGGFALLTGVFAALRGYVNGVLHVEAAMLVPLGVLTWGLYRLSGAFLEGKQRVALVGAIENGRYALIVPIQAALVVAGFGVYGLIWGLIAGQFLTFCVSYFGFARVIPARPSRSMFREFLDYSKYSYVQSVSSQLFKHADYILLGHFVGTGVTGVYKNVFTLTEASMLFSSALAQVALPQVSVHADEGNDEETTYLLGAILTYAGLFAIPVVGGGAIIGNDLLLTLYGTAAGTTVLPLIGAVGLANSLIPVLAIANLMNGYREGLEKFFLGTDRPRVYAISGFLLIAVYALTAIPLTDLYDSWGVAWATVFSFGASVATLFYLLDEPISPAAVADVGRQVVAMLAMTGVVYAVTLELGGAHGALRLAAVLAVGGATYFGVLLVLSERIRLDARGVVRDLRNQMLP